ncbi:MAG: BMP family ABC transporter substrate-binding protein [Chloroflexi bacterium]|nr:BMP family ABC transporter substrate-binding protein [Chloroflexota bacterium]MBU1751759.1 BMP family ABC transporter substrate-binding protein [Chloroflexota bacterium]MBU1880365.1 BMP family ABC transporter substrate-binding protein [Chloroflexota bacterium]
MDCVQCGKPNQPDARFCAQCGAPLPLSAPPGPAGGKKNGLSTPIIVGIVVVAILLGLCCCCVFVVAVLALVPPPGVAGTAVPTRVVRPVETEAPALPVSTVPAEIPLAPQTRLKVGLVTDAYGPINDKGFNQAAWDALLRAEKELGAEISYIESSDPQDYDKNIATLVDGGYTVIVTSGFNLIEATAKAARRYPNVKFIGTDQYQEETIPNYAGLIFEDDQGGFLAGALAASMSKSGVVGAVLGSDLVPPVVRFGKGYEAGARYINPNITVILTYHSGDISIAFVDPAWGAQTARDQIGQKADVVFGAGGQTGNGAIIAAAEDKVYCIGVDMDQYYTVPETRSYLLSSAVKLITPGTFDLIKAAQTGTFVGGNVVGDMGLAPFHDTESQVPAAVKAKLDQINKALRDGSLQTGVEP